MARIVQCLAASLAFCLFCPVHSADVKSWQVNPSDVIILEGILVFHDPRVRELMNMKIFVDTGPSILSLYLLFYAFTLPGVFPINNVRCFKESHVIEK